jgi:hypothetical protein
MKKEDNQNEEIVHDFQNGYLTLPFNEGQFKEFIKGLLGTPQTITKRIRGNFQMELKDLQNFYDLIDQRITQQNNGKLIQLKTQIYYSDDSSVILSSYEELITYNEVKPIISRAVKMTWSYLIQFADKTVPEKQEIELMIITSPQKNVIEVSGMPVAFLSSGQIHLTIQHTARSWGSDIESLLTNQINSILIKPNKFKDYIQKNSQLIGLLTFAIFFLTCFVTISITASNFNQNEITKTETVIKSAKTLDIKVDAILNYLATNSQEQFSKITNIYMFFSFFVALILAIWIANLASNRIQSYLVLTREAKTAMEKSIKKGRNKFILFFVSIGVSIITKIVASYIFKSFIE